jgi:hypothetical protein
MLMAVPARWFSWDFAVLEGSQVIAAIDVSWWREEGELAVQGRTFRVYREGLMRGAFVLESAGSVLARAEKPSAFRRAFVVEHGGRRYTFAARSPFQRAFELRDGSGAVGAIAPLGIFTRRARVDLPEDLPLAVRVFIVWLAVILWRRDANAAD